MDHRRVLGAVRRHARLAVTVTAVAAMVAGVTLAALPNDGGTHQPAGVLPPGSMGSLPSPHAWWNPRGWFSSGSQLPKPRRITVTGRPARTPVPRRAVAPKPRRVREVVRRRTANARVYRLSDGRLQADISAAPVNYADARGRWHPINVTVRPSTRPGYRYANTSNTFRSFFGTDPARLVRFQAPGGGWLRMGVDGTHPVRPRAAGNMVSYPQVAPGASLSYQVTPTALKESITLASAAAASSFSFTVKVGGGLVPYQHAGQIVFSRTGVGGPPVLVMPRPFMTDARRDPWSPLGVSWSPKVAQRVQWDPVARTLQVTVTPNARWLRQPERRFPVVIDPTINIAPPPGQAAPSTVISSDTPGTAYGSSWPLSVGTTPTGAMRSLLQFAMPNSIPAGTQIDSADLRLYRDQSFGSSPASQTIEVHQATGSWDASATWNSASGLTGAEGLNQVTVDDTDGSGQANPDTARTGNWPQATASAATNGEYVYNQDSTSGDSFTWIPRLTESGTYNVVAHYVATANAATSAPFTVNYSGGSQAYGINEQSGTGGVWASLGNHPFAAGNTGTVVLGDGPASSTTRVIADAVTFKLWGETVVNPSQANRWDSFPVRSIVQSWLNDPTTNFGVVVKTADESALGKGGPQYERAVDAYGGLTANDPQLVITYGRPAVTLNPVTTIRGDGADLSWTPYVDPTPNSDPSDDLAEYQVHRNGLQTFNPHNGNLVAPVPAGTTTYSDTSATPSPASGTPSVVYYMVTAKTKDGTLVAGPTQKVILPQAGFTTQVINASGATTLSQAQPATAEQHLAGQPWLSVGDNSATYGVTRTVLNFPSLSSQAIPAGAAVTGAQLRLWGWSNSNTGGGPATYEAHALARDFDPATATWNNASSGTPWTTPGGDFTPAAEGSLSALTNNPALDQWPVASAVQGWVNTPASQHGFLVKLSAESSGSPQEQELFLDTTAAEPALRPQLRVTYLTPTTENTYYVPTLPDDMTSATTYVVPVTITNTTGTTLSKSQPNAPGWVLSYHWTLPDGTDISDATNQLQTALPSDLPPGGTVTVQAQLKTPDITGTGNIRAAYTLGWDLLNTGTNPPTWLSQNTQGLPQIAPLDQPTSVTKPGPALLGLEKYYQYTGMSTGSGSALLNNDATGNVVWSYNAFSNPSVGFGTFVRLAYNSMDTSDSSMGFGWSLQASTLMRLGTPLDFHPNPQNNSATATLTDGDGTTHTFTRADATSPWVSPPGFHYFLQQQDQCDPSGDTQDDRAWVMTRPDRTQIWFDCQGYQSAVVDRNGNEADFTYETRTSDNQPVKFLDYITDPAGRQTLTINYYRQDDPAGSWSYFDPASGTVVPGTGKLTNPNIIDQVKSITDISGRTITFVYTTQGLMARMTDGDGSATPKVFMFGYDMTQGNKNVKLVSVTDPRTNTTGLAYYTAPTDPKFKWSLQTLTDRRNSTVGFAYAASTDPVNPGGINTVVTDQAGHNSTYQMDTTGKPAQVTNAKGQKTQLGWDGTYNVNSLTEDNGAHTTWTYDQNTGYPLTMTDAQANHDGTAGATYSYNVGLNGHIADLASILTPQQRLWTFGYDQNGNLTSVTDPDGNATGATAGSYTTHYTYYPSGELQTAQDANGNPPTNYSNYDANGLPQTITDPLNHAWTYTYDPRGNVLTSADPFSNPDVTSYHYDVFGRLGEIDIPKDHNASPPVYITIPAPVYDGNDNVTKSFDATSAETDYTYNPNDQLTSKTLPDDGSGTTRKYTYVHDRRGNLTSVTEPNGNAPNAPPGSYTTSYGYDTINELTSMTDAAGDPATIYGYDDVGNRTSVTDPRNNLTKQDYNLNHWPTVTTDPAGNTTKKGYDLDGLVTSLTDQNNNTTQFTLDPRGDLIQAMVPHDTSGATTTYFTTQYVYDQDGNRTQVLTPRALAFGYSRSSGCVATETCGYTYVTHYDANNHVIAQLSAYDPNGTYNTPAETDYTYNAAGRLTKVTAPPSATGGPAITKYTYWDNNWVKSSTDPWNITTSYDYDGNGQQRTRTITEADGSPTTDASISMSRTQARTYYPGGQLKTLTDDGVPTGLAVEMVDNADLNGTSSSGTWTKDNSASGYAGYNYQYHAKASSGSDTFTWNLTIPQDGNYTVYVKYPVVSGAATNASFKVYYSGGSATTAVNQTVNTGTGGWVSLGKHQFTQAGTGQKVTLTQNSGGIVVADAVKVVRDTTGITNTSHHNFTYSYDPTGNQAGITDNSTPAPAIASYAMTYDQLNRLTEVQEKNSSGAVQHDTTYGYDPASNLTSRTHDGASSTFTYDTRNLLSTQTDKASQSDTSPQKTQFTQYTPDGLLKTQIKPNGNTVAYTYFADGLLQHQIETTPAGTTVDEHTYGYTNNGDKNSDTEKVMSADNSGTYLTHTLAYSYDPRDRITKVTKDGTTTELYTHDANDNVTAQTIGTTQTTFQYDRDRLMTANSTVSYNYDPFGRLDTITSGTTPLERNTYDGFDNITAHYQGSTRTDYSYDPLNRMVSQTAGSTTTSYSYLGLTPDLSSETGSASKSYSYTPGGQRLYQYTPSSGTTTSPGYYTYNDHNDVEAVTGTGGNTTATYGYTAYGQPDPGQFTGNDKNNTQPGTGTPYNPYRYNAMRWDSASGQYDMGFRNYAPGLNQFLTRDMYNGALADMQLTTDPFTGNRYTFGAGNPISNIELDGHYFLSQNGACRYYQPGCSAAFTHPSLSIGELAAGAANTAYSFARSAVSVSMAILGVPQLGQKLPARLPIGKPTDPGYRLGGFAAGAATFLIPGAGEEDAAITGLGIVDRLAAKVAASCGGASFTAGTNVLLASGAAVPISQLKPGEKVLATNTKTGTTHAETVTAVLLHHDTDLYDLKIRANGKSAVIDTTSNHLFWVPGSRGHAGRWVRAGALRYGTHLRNPNGTTVTVTGGWTPKITTGWMWDLTINADHDFYVDTVVAPVLVHNCGPEVFPNLEPENLGRDEADALFAGVTPAAPGTGAFDRTIASGEIKWAVTKGLGLRVMPTEVGGFEDLYHSVLSGGDSVLAAGTARIDIWERSYYGRYITYYSGHFQPSEESLQLGIAAFRDIGIEFNEIRSW